jgi:hypothetical protein
MIIIRFPDEESKQRALGLLPGRFPGKSWATGEMMVPEEGLAFLAREGVKFTVEGPATYEQIASLRDPAAAKV